MLTILNFLLTLNYLRSNRCARTLPFCFRVHQVGSPNEILWVKRLSNNLFRSSGVFTCLTQFYNFSSVWWLPYRWRQTAIKLKSIPCRADSRAIDYLLSVICKYLIAELFTNIFGKTYKTSWPLMWSWRKGGFGAGIKLFPSGKIYRFPKLKLEYLRNIRGLTI